MKPINKQSHDIFEGWNHQTDFNRDQLILADILKGKTIKRNFPPLAGRKMQNSQNNLINSQVKLQPLRINHLLNLQYKRRGIRQKTEGCKQFYNDKISPLNKKLMEILNEEQLLTKNTQQTIIQQQIQQNRSELTYLKDQYDLGSEVKNKTNFLQKKIKASCNLQKMKSNQSQGNRLKKHIQRYLRSLILYKCQKITKKIFLERQFQQTTYLQRSKFCSKIIQNLQLKVIRTYSQKNTRFSRSSKR